MDDVDVDSVIEGVRGSRQAYCKFLSANDSGETGGHQAGILVSKGAMPILFDAKRLDDHIKKRNVSIAWQGRERTDATFTWYASKGELRITGFTRIYRGLQPERTGSLFVLARMDESEYAGYFLDDEQDIDSFLVAFGLSPVDTNRLMDVRANESEDLLEHLMVEYVSGIDHVFPETREVAIAAEGIEERSRGGRRSRAIEDPDGALIEFTRIEYELFRHIERSLYGQKVASGFEDFDDFIKTANSILNRRKSRAGKSLEHHLASIFDANGLSYTAQGRTEQNKAPDFMFPSIEAYHDKSFPVERLVMLAAKTTCKDRWRQILDEADRIKSAGRTIYLITLQQGNTKKQLEQMQSNNVQLVVPKSYIKMYPGEFRDGIWSLKRFIEYVRGLQGKVGCRT